jgi:hypothetical protein
MTEQKEQSESFVIRVWLEKREISEAEPECRGVIEHVATGRRTYLRDLDEIIIFIATYVEEWGITPRSWALMRRKIRSFSPGHVLRWVRR